MRFGVTGGRNFADYQTIIDALRSVPADATLVHGAATGADTLCRTRWAAMGRRTEAHPADWERHGKAAGPLRNQEMVDSGLDLLIAFPGGRGTADMRDRAAKAGVPIVHTAFGDGGAPTSANDDVLRAAVAEAYTDEGQRIWWSAYSDADDAKRHRMRSGVMAEWSGIRFDPAASIPRETQL